MATRNPKWLPEIINWALYGWDLLGDDVFWVYIVSNGKENKIQLINIITRCFYCKNPRWPPGVATETTKCQNFCYERPMIMFLVSIPRFLGVRNPFLHTFCIFESLFTRKSNCLALPCLDYMVGNGKENKIQLIKIITRCFFLQILR